MQNRAVETPGASVGKKNTPWSIEIPQMNSENTFLIRFTTVWYDYSNRN